MSHDNISDIRKVLYGDLNPPLPDTHNEDYYVPELCQLSRTEPVYTSLCRLSFQVPAPSTKVQYYCSRINNWVVTVINKAMIDSQSNELPHFENNVIFNYIKVSVIYCYLEFQAQFKNFIPTNKLLTQAYFYNIILKQAAPASPRATVSPVRTARLAPSTSRPSTVLRSPATPRSSSSTSSSTPPPVRSLETSLSRVSS